MAPILGTAETELAEQFYQINRLWPQSISELHRKEKNQTPVNPFAENPNATILSNEPSFLFFILSVDR